MSDKSKSNSEILSGIPAPKPVKREELRWPSAATHAGGAYIPPHCNENQAKAVKEG